MARQFPSAESMAALLHMHYDDAAEIRAHARTRADPEDVLWSVSDVTGRKGVSVIHDRLFGRGEPRLIFTSRGNAPGLIYDFRTGHYTLGTVRDGGRKIVKYRVVCGKRVEAGTVDVSGLSW